MDTLEVEPFIQSCEGLNSPLLLLRNASNCKFEMVALTVLPSSDFGNRGRVFPLQRYDLPIAIGVLKSPSGAYDNFVSLPELSREISLLI